MSVALQPELVEIRNWDIMFVHTNSQKREMVAARGTLRLSQFCENQQTVFDPHSGRGNRRSAGRSPLKGANKNERALGSPAKKVSDFMDFLRSRRVLAATHLHVTEDDGRESFERISRKSAT